MVCAFFVLMAVASHQQNRPPVKSAATAPTSVFHPLIVAIVAAAAPEVRHQQDSVVAPTAAKEDVTVKAYHVQEAAQARVKKLWLSFYF